MKDIIIEKLKQIEKDHQVKILFAIEAGSRAANIFSNDSDYDIRFVYCHTIDWYLSLDVNVDVIETVNDLFDIGGWGLRKTLKLFSKSNPSILDWIHSPIVYCNDFSLMADLKLLVHEYYSIKSRIHHSVNMANTNYRTYLQGDEVNLKRYFNVLRPLLSCMWTEKYISIPPLNFEILVNELVENLEVKNEMNTLIQTKRTGDILHFQPQNIVLNNFIEAKISYYKDFDNSIKVKENINIEKLDQLFRKTLFDAWK
ncbi:MAG: nucleotidyltransferase [Haloplasmataceae bacterium]|jgi:predicted nucleotidyltransferase|nr:nucleotidyltransferase [Haloplasmataceae bacterium]